MYNSKGYFIFLTPLYCRRQKEKRVTPDSQLSPLSCYNQPSNPLFSPGHGPPLNFPYDQLSGSHQQVKSEADWEHDLLVSRRHVHHVYHVHDVPHHVHTTYKPTTPRCLTIYLPKQTNQKAKWSQLVVTAWCVWKLLVNYITLLRSLSTQYY